MASDNLPKLDTDDGADRTTPRIGDVLVELGFITPDQLAAGLEQQRYDRRRLGEILVSMGVVAEEKIAKALRRQTGVEEWDPRSTAVHRRVVEAFPRELAIRHRVFPVAMRRNNIGVNWFVATTDPTDEALRNELGSVLCTPDDPVVVTWFVATGSNIDRAIQEHYSNAPTSEEPILLDEIVEEDSTPRVIARIQFAKRTPGSEN